MPGERTSVGDTGVGGALLTSGYLLANRLYIQSWLRFGMAAAILMGGHLAVGTFEVEPLGITPLTWVALLLVFYNVVLLSFISRILRTPVNEASDISLMVILHVSMVIDYLFLTALIWLVGGVKSPLVALYIVHVIIASVLTRPLSAFLHTALGYALLTGLCLGQWAGLIPIRFPVGIVNSAQPLDGRYVMSVLLVQGLLMGLCLFIVCSLMKALRQHENDLEGANDSLQRLSKMQRDFLHITIHDLKAPADAVAMHLQNLSSGLGGALTEQQENWVSRCLHRLREMTGLLRDFEVLAVIDTATIERQGEAIDPTALLHAIEEAHQDLASAHGHTLELHIKEDLHVIYGVNRLIHEAVANLATNAIKYTPDGGTIRIVGRNTADSVHIEVQDNGPGVRPEDQEALFQEFVRLRSRNGAAHPVPGTGLGLALVRRIVDMHFGTVRLESEPGKGSTFIIELPYQAALADHQKSSK